MADVLGDLERLQKLRESGTLNEDEFQAEKSRVLSNGQSVGDIDSTKSADSAPETQSAIAKTPSTFTPMDFSTIGVFIAALAMFLFLAPAAALIHLKFYVILSILSAIIIYVDARHIDMQGYDWNRAKWGFTTVALSIVTLPIYILKRDSFLEDIIERYGESISILINKIYLILIYAIVVIVFIYQIFVALNIGTFDTSQSASTLESASAEDGNKIAVSGPTQSRSTGDFNEAEQKIINDWQEADEGCRGSSDAQTLARWCARREITDDALNRAGICYGHDDDTSAADYDIHRCRPGSFGYTPEAASISETDIKSTVWDCSYLYGEEILVTLDARTYKFSPNNPNGGQSSGILTKGRAERHPYSGTMDTPLTLEGSKSGEWALVDGSEGIALLHYAEGSGDGSECTLPGQGPKYASNAN